MILDFISAVSKYYLSWFISSSFVYILILALFTMKVFFSEKKNRFIMQDLFGVLCSLILCVFLALIQGVIIGTFVYFFNFHSEISLFKKILYNSYLPLFLIAYDYFGKKKEINSLNVNRIASEK